MELSTELQKVEGVKNFAQKCDKESFETLQCSLLKTENREVTENSSFVKDFYNLVRSPQVEGENSLYGKTIELCVQLCERMKLEYLNDHRTLQFICRKAAWILLKDEKSSDFVEAIECAVNLGKNSAKWLLANSIQNPNLSLVGEVHQSLFELELARNILAVFKDDFATLGQWVKNKFSEFKTCSPNLSKALCEVVFKFIETSSDKNGSENQETNNMKTELMQVMFNVLLVAKLDLNNWVHQICKLVQTLNKENRITEAQEVCEILENEVREENYPSLLVLKLSVIMAASSCSSQSQYTQSKREQSSIVKEFVAVASKEEHFELFFSSLMTHRGVDYVESALQNILSKLECENSEDKLCNLLKAFVDVAVKSDRPQLLLGEVAQIALQNVENCPLAIVQQVWKYAESKAMFSEQSVSNKLSEKQAGDIYDDLTMDTDGSNNSSRNERDCSVRLMALAANLAVKCNDPRLDKITKAHIVRQLANRYIQEQNFQAATEALNESFKLDPVNPFLHYLWAQTCICQGDLASLEVQIERLWKNPQLELDAKIEIIANCILKCFERDFQKEGTNIALKVIRDLPSKCNSAKAISLGMMLLQKGQFDDSTENVLELLNMIQDMIEDKLYLQAEFCENLIKVCWNLSIGAGHTHALRLLRLLASFSSMFYYAKKNGHDVSATSSTLSMEEILFLWLKSVGQALILVQSAFHAGDMPNIDEISGGIIKEVFKVHQMIQATQYMNAQLAIDERETANCSPKSGNVSINDLFAGSQCSMVKESEVESTEKQKQSVKCGQQDLADITSFAIVARIDILLALKHDSQMIVQTVEDMAELYAKASSGDCLSLLMTVASSAKNKDAKEVELHCREMLLKNFKRQLKFQGPSASSDCKALNSGSTNNLQIAEKTNGKCLTPDQLLYCVIRYIKLNQELKRLLKEECVSDVEVMDLVMSSIEGIMQEIVQDSTLTATGNSKEVQQCNSKLQWLMVQLWNNGLGQADQGKKMEAVKMCNLALSVASRLSKWPGMLAYQKKMRHYFTSALASSSLSSPTPKTLFAD